jgi:hypothetical protein
VVISGSSYLCSSLLATNIEAVIAALGDLPAGPALSWLGPTPWSLSLIAPGSGIKD